MTVLRVHSMRQAPWVHSIEVAAKIPGKKKRWVWVNTYRYIFSGINIHLPAILGFTRYQGFDPSPDGKIFSREVTQVVHGGALKQDWPSAIGIIHDMKRAWLSDDAKRVAWLHPEVCETSHAKITSNDHLDMGHTVCVKSLSIPFFGGWFILNIHIIYVY